MLFRSENFIAEPNISAVIRRDSQNAIKNGILVKALLETNDGPTVVLIDELDKAQAETDAFLLDFINSGRLTNGQEEWNKGDGQIWVFITSNEKRELDDALLNRCRKITVERPGKGDFLEILSLPQNHYLGEIYNLDKSFSIRQAKSYLEDLEILGEEFDEDLLRQYVNIKSINISSVEELNNLNSEIETEEEIMSLFEVENNSNIGLTMKELKKNFDFAINRNNKLAIKIKTLSQFKILIDNEIIRYGTWTVEMDQAECFSFRIIDEISAGRGSNKIGYLIGNDGRMVEYFVNKGKMYVEVIGNDVRENFDSCEDRKRVV